MTNHEALMRRAMQLADNARLLARPNPWVGAVLVCANGEIFEGHTQRPGDAHAEIMALRAANEAGASTSGATLYSTLEPCSHTGRTGPCTDAIISAGITHVVVGITDPDEKVSGTGVNQLRQADIQVNFGVLEDDIEQQLAPYLHHRRTGRPFVVLKMASTLDARTFLPKGPRWITGDKARRRVHEIRAHSDAIVVGAHTVLTDDPELTVRHIEGESPRRVVLSRSTTIPADAKVHPCEVWGGDIESLLDSLGQQGVLQVLVEGGATVATAFHQQGLINQYIFHIAPIVSGSAEAPGVFTGDASVELNEYNLITTTSFDDDLEIVLEPKNQKVGAL